MHQGCYIAKPPDFEAFLRLESFLAQFEEFLNAQINTPILDPKA
jgi:hypothetical protein